MSQEREPFRWTSTLSFKNISMINLRGYDTSELAENRYTVADILFILFQSRIPKKNEVKMLNYLTILFLDEGMSPSTVVSRIAIRGRPFITQAIGAGIEVFGHQYGSVQDFGNIMSSNIEKALNEKKSLKEMAKLLVDDYLKAGKEFPGVHLENVHADIPAHRTLKRAETLGTAGIYQEFFTEVLKALNDHRKKEGKSELHPDMVGAGGSALLDLGFSPESSWAILIVCRAYGCGAHCIEEMERGPLGQYGVPQKGFEEYEYDGTKLKPVPPIEERDKYTKPIKSSTVEEWKQKVEEQKKIKGIGWTILKEEDEV